MNVHSLSNPAVFSAERKLLAVAQASCLWGQRTSCPLYMSSEVFDLKPTFENVVLAGGQKSDPD